MAKNYFCNERRLIVIYFFIVITITSISCKNESKEKLLEKGAFNAGVGNYKEAIRYFTKVINEDNKSYEAYKYRGFAYIQLEEYKSAIHDLNNSIDLNHGDNFDAYLMKGFASDRIGDTITAIKCYSTAVVLEPNSIDALYLRGKMLVRYRNIDLAIDDFNKILKLDKNSELAKGALHQLELQNWNFFRDSLSAVGGKQGKW